MSKRTSLILVLGMLTCLNTESSAMDISELIGGSGGNSATVNELFLARMPNMAEIFSETTFVDRFKTKTGMVTIKVHFARNDVDEESLKPKPKRGKVLKRDGIGVVFTRTQEAPLLPMGASLNDLMEEFEKNFDSHLPEKLRTTTHPSPEEVQFAIFESLPACTQKKLIDDGVISAAQLLEAKCKPVIRQIERDKQIYAFVTSYTYSLSHAFSSPHGTLSIALEGKLDDDDRAGAADADSRFIRPFPSTWDEAKKEVITGINDHLSHLVETITNAPSGVGTM